MLPQMMANRAEIMRRERGECPHPARRGNHEEYVRSDGSTFCRACGEELTPPTREA